MTIGQSSRCFNRFNKILWETPFIFPAVAQKTISMHLISSLFCVAMLFPKRFFPVDRKLKTAENKKI
jgi:hypothetical protein